MTKQLFLTLILLSAVLGCTQQTVNNVSPDSGAEYNSPELMIGTGDSGGGNGVKGKALEEYRISLATLESYNKIVENHVQEIKLKVPEFGLQLEMIFKNKIWYLVPAKLATIRSEDIGVAFSTEQLALQNTYEIWLDKEMFDKMTLEEQATLLIHEALMGLKINLDKSYKDRLTKRRSPVDGINVLKKEDYIVEISKLDYSRIRTMTSYIADDFYRTNTDLFISNLEEMEFGNFISYEALKSLRATYGRNFTTTQIIQGLQAELQALQSSKCTLELEVEKRNLTIHVGETKKSIQMGDQSIRPSISYKGVVEIKLYTAHESTLNAVRSVLTIHIQNDIVSKFDVEEENYSYNLKNGLAWRPVRNSKLSCF